MDALTMGELVAVLALCQDNSFGQPLESQMRSTVLAMGLAYLWDVTRNRS